MSRTLVYKEEKMTSVYEVVRERECDPHPGKYSLWCTGNGSIHPELRGYDYSENLVSVAKSRGYKVLTQYRQFL